MYIITFYAFQISPNATDVCKSVIKATENLPIGGPGTSLMNMAHLKFILDKMEKTTSYYTYSGRETQPPCNQGTLLKGIANTKLLKPMW